MLFTFQDEWQQMSVSGFSDNQAMTGCIRKKDLEEGTNKLCIPKEILEYCNYNQLFYRRGVWIEEDFSFCVLPIIRRDSPKEERDRFAIMLDRNRFLVILIEDEKHVVEPLFLETMEKCRCKSSPVRVLYSFLDGLLERDAQMLENMDFRIARLEEKLVKEKMGRDFHNDIFQMKRELLPMRSYYEQLLEIGARLHEDDNHLLKEEEREQFHRFADRAKRFCDNTDRLKESLVEVREACESFLNLNMNSIMKVFTVITTVFLPLTLMTGWYGMNFKYMPEFYMEYGYLGFSICSLLVLVGCLLFFKLKKFI